MRLWSSRRHKSLPLPPLAMRQLVGRPDASTFEEPERRFSELRREQLRSVLDFGCGCGRHARLLAEHHPDRYVGVDLHRGMVDWASENLASRLRGFTFVHHDVFSPGMNPDVSLPRSAPLPAEDASVTLMLAVSVFTHLVQDQAEHYLKEAARILAPEGVIFATFFLFEKAAFPMMQDFQNALYINYQDPTNAVLFDRDWLLKTLHDRGLRVRAVVPPELRGFHWHLEIEHGQGSVDLPPDCAPVGHQAPPVCATPAHTIV